MLRGTRVGQAYIAVSADGSGVNEEIVDSVHEAGPGVEREGDEQGKNFGDRFSGGFLSRMRARLQGNELSQQMSKSFDRDADRSGDRIGSRIGGHVVDALNFALSKEGGDNPLSELFDRMTRDNSDDADRTGHRLGDILGAALGDRMEEVLARQGDMFEDLIDRANKARSNSGTRSGATTPGDQGFDISGMVGGLFGKGSRNNFLNVLGSIAGGITGVFESIGKFAAKAPALFGTFADGFSQASEGASLFEKAGSGASAVVAELGISMAGIAEVAPLVVIGIIAVVGALVVLASIVGALIGLIGAVVSTIAGALVGALVVGGAAVVALAGSVGLLVAAFTSLTDAQRKVLSDSFAPLKAELTGIGQLVLQDLIPHFATWADNVSKALVMITPLASVMGEAFGQAGDIISAALSGPGFQKLTDSLTRYLPGIITGLASAFGSFANGMAAIFAVVMPIVQRFMNYLAGVADEFSRWANSTKGQNSIEDFVGRAVHSLMALWNAAKQVFGLIADFLFDPATMHAGNEIFNGIAKTFAKFRQQLKSADLKSFFADAIKFGSALWDVIVGVVKLFFSFYNSGVLDMLARGMEVFAAGLEEVSTWIGPLLDGLMKVPDLADSAVTALTNLGDKFGWLGDRIDDFISPLKSALDYMTGKDEMGLFPDSPGYNAPNQGAFINSLFGHGIPGIGSTPPALDLSDLFNLGNTALHNTSSDYGGYLDAWKNPYVDLANSLMDDGPGIMQQIKQSLMDLAHQLQSALRQAAHATSGADVRSGFRQMAQTLRDQADQMIEQARSAINSAASSLASASTPQEAQAAFAAIHEAQAAMQAALRNQERLKHVSQMLDAQGESSKKRVNKLLDGLKVENATLADYAVARGKIADQLSAAQTKLANAIQMRESMQTSVTDAINTFGALTTATAKVVDGIQQALTATDITTNLQDKLKQIKAFRKDLQLLATEGLSNDAYQQIVSMGVEGGTAYAEALLGGGVEAIQQTNNLVGSITSIADKLGVETSNRLYQAGVDAAKGLIDGLEKMSDRLDRAATRLGDSIAAAIKKALDIHSPSRVMMSMMDDVGDGMVIGLGNQRTKVGSAAASLAGQVAVSPEVAAYTAKRNAEAADGEDGVSGNGNRKFRDLVVHTPTEDPIAVAHEVLNEVTGRL